MKRFLLLFSLLLLTVATQAQFKTAVIGVNGLTCSMCQKSVEKALYRLKFVKSIETDLEKTSLTVTFEPGSEVIIAQLAQKVKSAGFSVRNLDAVFHFQNYNAANNSDFKFGNATYHFILANNITLSGDKTIRFVGNNYMSKDEFKKYSAANIPPFNSFVPVYYVTLP